MTAHGRRLATRGLQLLLAGLLAVTWQATPARANGLVGGSCTETDLDNALAGGGPVTFSCGVAPHIIVLSGQKTISLNTTLDGGGLITLSGGNSSRLFLVNSGRTLTLNNLVLTNGNAGAGYGGAVYNAGGTLVLNHSTIQNSQTNNTSGGAIVSFGGAITLTDSLVQGNHGYSYGAVSTDGALYMSHSIIRDNAATIGGGGLVVGGPATIGHSQIYSNTIVCNCTAGWGGGLYVSATGNVQLVASQVYFNSAIEGGGVYNLGTVTVSQSTLSSNWATGSVGGGLDNRGTATLTAVTVNGNSAGTFGGGLYNEGHDTLTLTLTNVTLAGNGAGIDGGGLYNFGTASLNNDTLSGNSAGSSGGGLYSLGTATLKNTLLADNSENCHYAAFVIASAGFNFSTDASCTPFLNQGSDVNGQPARLNPLADNGGPTLTYLPQPRSLVIDAGTGLGCPATDQRGVARPQGVACDIGAVEVQGNENWWRLFLPLVRR